MKHRIVFAGLMLSVLFTVVSCGKKPAESVAPQEPASPAPAIVSDSGQAETLEDYYDRTAIIARNEWRDSTSMLGFDTDVWVLEYAALRHPGWAAQAEFESGYAAPDGLFTDQLQGGSALWRVILTDERGTVTEEKIQTFFFAEKQKICLSGLLAGESILPDREQGYAYLALDPRFSARMQAVPTPEEPEETAAIELARLCGGENRQDAYPLTETRAALVQVEKRVVLYDFDTASAVQEMELGAGWLVERLENGALTLALREGTGWQVTRRMTVTAEGINVTNVDGSDEEPHPVGSETVTERDGSLYLGEKVLLAGGGTYEDAIGYRFRKALDDHRFAYDCWGYEWLDHSGIYDLAAGEDHPLGEAASGIYLLDVSDDGATAMTCRMEDLGYCYDYALTDLAGGERTELSLGPRSVEEGTDVFPSVSGNLSRLCLWSDGEEGCTITIYDTDSQKAVFTWEIARDAASVTGVTLLGERTLYVSMHRYSTGGEWLYRVEY